MDKRTQIEVALQRARQWEERAKQELDKANKEEAAALRKDRTCVLVSLGKLKLEELRNPNFINHRIDMEALSDWDKWHLRTYHKKLFNLLCSLDLSTKEMIDIFCGDEVPGVTKKLRKR